MKKRFTIKFKSVNSIFKVVSILFLFVCQISFSQYNQLSPNAEISVLTMGPGNSLNDTFGHSAYRIKDKSLDIVFNYGVYDFDAPNFYLKFAQGKLNYKIDVNNYDAFKNYYVRQNRTIKEQVLNLTLTEKQQVFNYLANNYEPENQFYLYDFFYDNCATKIKDVLVESLEQKVKFNEPKSLGNKTFRTLIYDNVDWNSWGSLGIDVALGSVIDRQAAKQEYMFLPEYIHTFFDNATIKNNSEKKLVKESKIIFSKTAVKQPNYFLVSPIFVLGILGLCILYLTFLDFKNNKRTKWLDLVLFSVTGIIGVFILLLWFATDHEATAQNYNLLWAFVINIFVIGQVLKQKPKAWFTKYLKFLIIMLCLLTMHWIVGIQRFAFTLIPILLALFIRYLYLINFYERQSKE